jgi:hypothetical protein
LLSRSAKINAFQNEHEPGQLQCATIVIERPYVEASPFKAFAPDAKTSAIPEQDLHHGSALVEKSKEVSTKGICT